MFRGFLVLLIGVGVSCVCGRLIAYVLWLSVHYWLGWLLSGLLIVLVGVFLWFDLV